MVDEPAKPRFDTPVAKPKTGGAKPGTYHNTNEDYQKYCVDHQAFVDDMSPPTPTPDELHRIMAGEDVELEPSGIEMNGRETSAEAIHRAMLGAAVPPEPLPVVRAAAKK